MVGSSSTASIGYDCAKEGKHAAEQSCEVKGAFQIMPAVLKRRQDEELAAAV